MTTTHITDTLRHAADLSREAQLLKTLATDAVEDGMHAARRTIRHAKETVKSEPVKAMAVIFAAGAVLGLGLGLLCRRQPRKASS